jgi:transcriptional regulator with XRE-family HTH domain
MSQETFGQRFARLRKEKGFTQETIADKLHVSAQAVSKWETDSSLPDISLLSDISDLLDVTTDELLGKEKKDAVAFKPAATAEDIENRMLKVKVTSQDGDRVRINLPVKLVEMLVNSGSKMNIEGSKSLEGIDWKQVMEMIKSGAIGNLVEVESGDGDVVQIFVE